MAEGIIGVGNLVLAKGDGHASFVEVEHPGVQRPRLRAADDSNLGFPKQGFHVEHAAGMQVARLPAPSTCPV